MPIKVETPTPQQIVELRNRFIQKLQNEPPAEPFHPADIDRVKNADLWCIRFLEMYDLDLKICMEKLWETCIWRKKFGTNDLSESNIRMEYATDGVIFSRNKDVDGKPLLIFKTKLHIRGTKDMDDVIRVVVYWIERIQRETNWDKMTAVFDMAGCGISSMDLDFVRRIIDTFKQYYPNSLNYILVYEMAWVLNAAFKIIKGLLPAKALEILKMITKKDIQTYIDKDNCLKEWGGNDDYVFQFVPEKLKNKPMTNGHVAAASEDQLLKKVHFDESPGETFSFEQEDGLRPYKQNSDEMLRLSPNEFLSFTKGESSESKVDIACISQIPVTYKIQTTSPEKFRVRPRSGILNPGETVSVSILLKAEHHLSEGSKDKFLVMSIPVPPGTTDLSPQQMQEIWKHKQSNSPDVEQHRLCCTYKGAGEFAQSGYPDKGETKGAEPVNLAELSRHAKQLEHQLKFTQLLQCVTLIFLLILSVAVVYLLKLQTDGAANSVDPDNALKIDPMEFSSCPLAGGKL